MGLMGRDAAMRFLAGFAFVCLGVLNSAAQSRVTELAQPDPIATAHGKPVVLIFVRSDCPISRKYAPEIQQLATKYKDRATFWLVFPSRDDSVDIVDKHVREFRYNIAALRDPSHELVRRAQVNITPEAAVFDAQGNLRYHGRIDDLYISFGRSRSAATEHDLDDALSSVVAGMKVDRPSAPAVGCYIADTK